MNVEQTPSNLSDLFAGTGTAPAREVENMELGTDIPRIVNPTEINREATRWLVFVGDVITPKTKRERHDLVIGEEYLSQQVSNLGRTKGHVRRCQLTPMEIGVDYIPDEVLGANETGLAGVDKFDTGNPSVMGSGSKGLNLVRL